MGKIFRKTLVIMIVLTIILVNFSTRVAAASPKENLSAPTALNCFSLDLVFIIDQSGSMGGQPSIPAHDPTGQRAYGPRWAIDWLTDNALDICPEAFHRVALISFGSEAQIDLGLSDINPTNTDEWAYLRKTLKAKIQLLDLGDTNPTLAFEMAKQLLDQASPISDLPRKRVIIFMTDGMPCVNCLTTGFDMHAYAREMQDQIASDFSFDLTLFNQEKCLNEAQSIYGKDNIPAEVTNKCLEDNRLNLNAYQTSTYIWTLLLSFGENWPLILRTTYQNISESHGGKAIDITDNRNEIPAIFLEIMTKLAEVPVTRLSCGNFAVNPFVRQARLTFFKLSEDTEIRISYVDITGVNHEVNNGEVTNGGFSIYEHYLEGANERYVFDFPYPGIWRIESDACQGIDAFYDPVQLNVTGGLNPVRLWNPGKGEMLLEESNLPEFDQAPFYNSDRPYYIQYQMQDVEGNIINNPEGDFFGVKFDIKVVDPEGNVEPYDMQWQPNEQKFLSTKPILLPMSGEYKINLAGSVPYRDYPYGPFTDNDTAAKIYDQKNELFRYEGGVFKAFDVTPFMIEIVSPTSDTKMGTIHVPILKGWWPLKVNPIPVRAQIIRGDGSAMPGEELSQALTDPANAIGASVTQGDKTSETITLIPDPAATGEYTGYIPGFEVAGEQKLTIKLQSDYTERYRPSNNPAEDSTAFTRSDTLWTKADTYIYVFFAIIFLIIEKIIICVINARSMVSGDLIFESSSANERVELRGKLCSKNRVNLGPPLTRHTRKIRENPQWDILRILVEHRPSIQDGDSKRKVIRLRISLLSETNGYQKLLFLFLPAWLVKWNREFELVDNQSTGPYSDFSTAVIIYKY